MRKKKKGLTSYYYSLQSIRKSAKNKRNKVKWRQDKALQVTSQSFASGIAKLCRWHRKALQVASQSIAWRIPDASAKLMQIFRGINNSSFACTQHSEVKEVELL